MTKLENSFGLYFCLFFLDEMSFRLSTTSIFHAYHHQQLHSKYKKTGENM